MNALNVRSASAASPTSVTDALLGLFILSLPLSSVFSFSPLAPPPLLLGIALLVWRAWRGEVQIDTMTFVFLGLLLLCCLPLVFSVEFVSPKTMNHIVAFAVSVIVYYTGVRSALIDLVRAGRVDRMQRLLFIALCYSSLYILLEFAGSNLGGPDVRSYVPYLEVQKLDALIFGVFLRPRGFASEPANAALFYNLALFLVLPWLKGRPVRILIYLVLILPGYFMLFSAASFVGCAVAAVLLLGAYFWRRALSTSAIIVAFIGVVGTAMTVFTALGTPLFAAFDEVVLSRLGLFSGNAVNSSASERSDIYTQIIDVMTAYPLGIGFGITPGLAEVGGNYRGWALAEGQISLFGMFAVAGGIAAVVIFTMAMGVALRRALTIPGIGPFAFAAGLALCLQHLFVTEYWLPYLWFFVAFAGAGHVRPGVASSA